VIPTIQDSADSNVDYIVIGGGIVGLSTAWQLLQRESGARLVLLEKESELSFHQTGHNSGVIHAGIYYEPGSLKAEFCREGLTATIDFCQANNIPYEQCGKLIVATSEQELARLQNLYERGLTNGLDLQLLSADELREKEPNVTGLGAILVTDTGIVDYRKVCKAIAEKIRSLNGEIRLNSEVVAIDEQDQTISVTLAEGKTIETGFLVSCGGLMADRLVRMHGLPVNFQIIPYRGEYYRLPASKSDLVNHLIYPVPDPELPFLGIHLTRMIDGSITVGPNAVQGWKREGYGRINFSTGDTLEMLKFSGFWKSLAANLKPGISELANSLLKTRYLQMVRKYCPSVESNDLSPHPAGIRAQAVLPDGTLVHDFLFAESKKSLHVCNAPSPAATSAIPIGRYICDRVKGQQA
jgi:L-2-hydroxyglutarate oxidase